LTGAEQRRRLNPRAVDQPHIGPELRSGLDALEHSAVVLRALYLSIAEQVRHQPEGGQPYAEEIRGVFAELLRDLARALRSYGALIRAAAQAANDGTLPTAELPCALEAAGARRGPRLTELLLLDAREQPDCPKTTPRPNSTVTAPGPCCTRGGRREQAANTGIRP